MATIVNLGNQKITFDFKNPVKGSEFNRLLYGSVRPGVYKGLNISIANLTSINISPGIAFLNTSYQAETKRTVVAEFRGTINFPIVNTSINQYIYLKYDYKEIVENWVQVATVPATGSVPVNSVVIGTVYFNEGVLTSADYSNKTWGLYRADGNQYSINDIITFSDVNDYTKQVRFAASGVSSGSVRIIHVPDYDYSLNTVKDWVSGRNYKIDEIAVFKQVIYRSLVNHTSVNFELEKSNWESVGGGASLQTTYVLTYSSWSIPNQDLEILINHNLDRQIQTYVYDSSGNEEYFTAIYRIDTNNVKIVLNWGVRDVLFPLGNSSPSITIRIVCV